MPSDKVIPLKNLCLLWKLCRNDIFTYNVVVICGRGQGNLFSLLPEQFTLAPTPRVSGKNCSSQTHCFGHGVMTWLKLTAQKRMKTNTIINEFIALKITALICRIVPPNRSHRRSVKIYPMEICSASSLPRVMSLR